MILGIPEWAVQNSDKLYFSQPKKVDSAARLFSERSLGNTRRSEDIDAVFGRRAEDQVHIRRRLGGGGGVSVRAGWESSRMKLSKPPGSVTRRNRASSESTVNVCGMSRGPNTNDPADA